MLEPSLHPRAPNAPHVYLNLVPAVLAIVVDTIIWLSKAKELYQQTGSNFS